MANTYLQDPRDASSTSRTAGIQDTGSSRPGGRTPHKGSGLQRWQPRSRHDWNAQDHETNEVADAFTTGFPDSVVLLTVEETMRLLRVGRTKLYELIDSHAFATVKVGGSRRIVAASLHNYLTGLLVAE